MRSRIPNFYLRITTIFALFAAISFGYLKAQDGHGQTEHGPSHSEGHSAGKQEERVADIIIHHVMDSHDWHITDIGETPIALHLPWIIYNSQNGLDFFMSTHAMLEKDEHYLESHDHVYYVQSRTPVHSFHALADSETEKEELKKFEAEEGTKYAIIRHSFTEVDAAGNKKPATHADVYELVPGVTVIDFSLTKTGLQILLIAVLLFFMFTSVAKAYKKRDGLAPKGMQSFFEPVILFVRDDVGKPYMHGKHERYTPYLLTLFFFIWFSNILGLTPLSSNIMGNTTITLMLAMLTFVLIVASATKDFWLHILWFPGVPIWMKPLMFVVELMGFLTKPAALAIRLFANISAGHFMVLSLISLIFILGDMGRSPGGAIGIMPLSIVFSLFIFAVEVLVAAVQAFVFSLLTAVFIGQALESHDHGHDHAHDDAHAHAHH